MMVNFVFAKKKAKLLSNLLGISKSLINSSVSTKHNPTEVNASTKLNTNMSLYMLTQH